MIDIDTLKWDKRPQSALVIHALIDRLEAAESDALEQARLNGMGSEREAALMAKLEAAERERDECNRRRLEAADHFAAQTALMKEKCDALRAKIADMERQEPVAWYSKQYGFVYMSRHSSQFEHGSILYLRNGTPAWRIEGSSKVALLDMTSLPHGTVFYALPGAKEQEPTRDWWDCLIADISAIDCMYRGSPTYAHDAYWMREHVVRMLEQRRDALPGAQTQGEGK